MNTAQAKHWKNMKEKFLKNHLSFVYKICMGLWDSWITENPGWVILENITALNILFGLFSILEVFKG